MVYPVSGSLGILLYHLSIKRQTLCQAEKWPGHEAEN
jgi:hypothetical protein